MSTARKHAETSIWIRTRRIAPYPVKWGEPQTHTGRISLAISKLSQASHWGCHLSEFRRDDLARLEQAGVPFQLFARPTCGSTRDDFVRLTVEVDVISPREVAA